MPGDGHVRCGGRARETGQEESRHRALVRSHFEETMRRDATRPQASSSGEQKSAAGTGI